MPSWITTIVVDRIIKAIVDWISIWVKGQQAKKRAKKQVDEIKKETDPVKRASDLDNLFK